MCDILVQKPDRLRQCCFALSVKMFCRTCFYRAHLEIICLFMYSSCKPKKIIRGCVVIVVSKSTGCVAFCAQSSVLSAPCVMWYTIQSGFVLARKDTNTNASPAWDGVSCVLKQKWVKTYVSEDTDVRTGVVSIQPIMDPQLHASMKLIKQCNWHRQHSTCNHIYMFWLKKR